MKGNPDMSCCIGIAVWPLRAIRRADDSPDGDIVEFVRETLEHIAEPSIPQTSW